MRRKVVHILWQLTFGGIQTMLVNIANAQAEAGAEVTVIFVDAPCETSLLRAFSADVKVVCLRRKAHSMIPVFLFRLNCELCHIQPDTIHLHASNLYKLIFSHRLSREACVTLHALPRGSVRRRGISNILPLWSFKPTSNVAYIDEIPKVFAISKAVQEKLSDAYGVDSTVVNNGIKTGDFARRLPQAPDKGRLRVVQVGRLMHDKKGQDLLIEAVARLDGKVTVDFVGTGESEEYLRLLAKNKGVEEYIHFLGDQTQQWIGGYLCTYDLFVQPSRYEGFGLTVAEAMAACVPVLVSTGQGPEEITCGSKYGWLFKNGDVKTLIQSIRYIRSHYDEALLKAGEACRYVEAAYDVSITAQKYLAEYESRRHTGKNYKATL